MLLDDGQISARLTPQAAVAAMRQAITDAERGHACRARPGIE